MPEEQEKLHRAEKEIFTPALQEAAKKARAEGYVLEDVVFATANAYLNMMVAFMGKEKALALLEDQVSFLRSRIEE